MTIIILSLFLFPLTLLAEVITDGSLGPSSTLQGPHYQIEANLGQQQGGNLFHSFQYFNLNSHESATFSGPNQIQNIISRVTGGNPSQIDGTIRSTIPNANLYFLNPYGIVFGPNARLDVQGSFHASTADYLRFGKGAYFSARFPNSILTTAPVEAFGFLNNHPASIQIEGSLREDGKFEVNENKTLSIIGGDLFIKNATLYAPSGQINLMAIASAGEFIPTFSNSEEENHQFGRIELSHLLEQRLLNEKDTKIFREVLYEVFGEVHDEDIVKYGNIDVSGSGGGQIFIRAGELIMDNSAIFADTYGEQDGAMIDIFVDGNLELMNGARITANNVGSGNSHLLKITATDRLQFSGLNLDLEPEFYEPESVISTENMGSGKGADIEINTPNLAITPGIITTATIDDGIGGNIDIKATQIKLQSKPIAENVMAIAVIGATTEGIGPAGDITIHANESIFLENLGTSVSTSTVFDGHAGNISLETQRFTLNFGEINSFSLGSGNAGTINITTKFALLNNSQIVTASTLKNTDGGNINFLSEHLIIKDSSVITAQFPVFKPEPDIEPELADDSQNIESISHLESGSGNIELTSDNFVLDSSQLLTYSIWGKGGNINIQSDTIQPLGDSLINASSLLGLNGSLIINNIDISQHLAMLPMIYIDPTTLIKEGCHIQFGENSSSFFFKGRDGSPIAPDDFQTHSRIFTLKGQESLNND